MNLERKIQIVKNALLEKFPDVGEHYTIIATIWTDGDSQIIAQHGNEDGIHKFSYRHDKLEYEVEEIISNAVLIEEDGTRVYLKENYCTLDITLDQFISKMSTIERDAKYNNSAKWLSETFKKILENEPEESIAMMKKENIISFLFEEDFFELVYTTRYLDSINVEWEEGE